MALDQYPTLTWPLVLRQLAAAQVDFLAGDCYTRPAEATRAMTGGQQAPPPPLLAQRFAAAAASGEATAAGGSTDAAVRLTHLLKGMAAANNNVIESKARDWVPLFLAFTAASPTQNGTGDEDGAGDAAAAADTPAAVAAEDESEDEEAEGAAQAGVARSGNQLTGRSWRMGLREWLALMEGLRGARGMFQWEAVQVSSVCLVGGRS